MKLHGKKQPDNVINTAYRDMVTETEDSILDICQGCMTHNNVCCHSLVAWVQIKNKPG
jgi:uncharacterized protein YuzB (UPF0349 family)